MKRLLERYPRLAVRREFYMLTKRYYPNADTPDRILLQRLLLCGKIDKETGGIVFTQEFVRDVTGQRTSMRDILEAWADRMDIGLEIIDSDRRYGRATVVIPNLPHELSVSSALEYIGIYLQKDRSSRFVDFVTGEAITPHRKRANRENRRASVAAAADPKHDYRDLLDFLNDSRQRRCSEIIAANLPAVLNAVLRMPSGNMVWRKCRDGVTRYLPNREMVRREQNIRALMAVVSDATIYYKTVSGSPRLYAEGVGALSFTRDTREIAFHGCWYVDLKSVQLGILAAVAGCPSVLEFLRSGSCWWTSLANEVGVDPKFYKPALKIGTYMIPFGASVNSIRWNMLSSDAADTPLTKSQVERFLEHPMIRELLEARNSLLGTIVNEGGMRDARGNWIPLSKYSEKKPDDKHRARSVLAYVAQSYEMYVMSAIKGVVEADNHMSLVAWIHDGAVLSLSGRVNNQIAQLQKAVEDRLAQLKAATGLDIPTYLETESLGSMVCDCDFDELDLAA